VSLAMNHRSAHAPKQCFILPHSALKYCLAPIPLAAVQVFRLYTTICIAPPPAPPPTHSTRTRTHTRTPYNLALSFSTPPLNFHSSLHLLTHPPNSLTRQTPQIQNRHTDVSRRGVNGCRLHPPGPPRRYSTHPLPVPPHPSPPSHLNPSLLSLLNYKPRTQMLLGVVLMGVGYIFLGPAPVFASLFGGTSQQPTPPGTGTAGFSFYLAGLAHAGSRSDGGVSGGMGGGGIGGGGGGGLIIGGVDDGGLIIGGVSDGDGGASRGWGASGSGGMSMVGGGGGGGGWGSPSVARLLVSFLAVGIGGGLAYVPTNSVSLRAAERRGISADQVGLPPHFASSTPSPHAHNPNPLMLHLCLPLRTPQAHAHPASQRIRPSPKFDRQPRDTHAHAHLALPSLPPLPPLPTPATPTYTTPPTPLPRQASAVLAAIVNLSYMSAPPTPLPCASTFPKHTSPRVGTPLPPYSFPQASAALAAIVNLSYCAGAAAGPLLGGALVPQSRDFASASAAFGIGLLVMAALLLPLIYGRVVADARRVIERRWTVRAGHGRGARSGRNEGGGSESPRCPCRCCCCDVFSFWRRERVDPGTGPLIIIPVGEAGRRGTAGDVHGDGRTEHGVGHHRKLTRSLVEPKVLGAAAAARGPRGDAFGRGDATVASSSSGSPRPSHAVGVPSAGCVTEGRGCVTVAGGGEPPLLALSEEDPAVLRVGGDAGVADDGARHAWAHYIRARLGPPPPPPTRSPRGSRLGG
jgi:hypothetical protein